MEIGSLVLTYTHLAFKSALLKPIKVIGKENSQWVAMDYEDVMVHIFLPDTREYYDLDHLWDDAELTVIPDIE